LQQRGTTSAAKGAAPTGRIPARSSQLIKVAAIVRGRTATVCCPPSPLQRASRALEIRGDNEAHLVRACPGRQVPALRICLVNRLTIATAIVRHTTSWRARSPELVPAQATLGVLQRVAQLLIADAELKVALMVCGNADLKLHGLPSGEGGLRTFHKAQVVATGRPLATLAAHTITVATMRAIAVHRGASDTATHGRKDQVAMTVTPRKQAHQSGDNGCTTRSEHDCKFELPTAIQRKTP
jgi:hypothetical protein